MPLIGRGISWALWQSASKGSCQWFTCVRIDGARELLRRSKLSQAEAALPTRRRAPPAFCIGSSRAALDAVQVPDTFVNEAVTRWAHPTVIRLATLTRVPTARAPHLPCPRASGAAKTRHNRLVAENRVCRLTLTALVATKMINSRPIMRFLNFQPIGERPGRPASAFSAFSTESQTRNSPQLRAPYEGPTCARGKVTPAAAKPSAGCKSANPHGIIADACCRLYS
jgi:hypothetical protein